LGLVGVVGALLLSHKPLGFVAILGVLALAGMIARNSVILIDQVEKEKAAGRHPWDALIEATTHRFRPILLTASAAILGMIPIAPTVFWGPMAYAIMGGLAVAMLLTLIFLPAPVRQRFELRGAGEGCRDLSASRRIRRIAAPDGARRIEPFPATTEDNARLKAQPCSWGGNEILAAEPTAKCSAISRHRTR
jgi:predicted RND superfamily exporter protein